MGPYFTVDFWIRFFTENNGFTPDVFSALFIISFTESCCFIIPPDFLLPFVAIGKPAWAVIVLTLFTTFASVVGAMFGYLIGKWGGQPLLHKFFKKEKTDKVEDLFQKYDTWAIGIAAFTPIPYKVFTVSAGVFNLHFTRFIIVSIFARGTRYMLIAMISYMALKNMTPQQVSDYLHGPQFKLVTLGIFATFVGLYLIYRKVVGKNKEPAAA
ncbi:YqaA family protein [bacterium]